MRPSEVQEREFTSDQKQRIEKDKEYFIKLVEKSNEYFEKQLIYVSAGTLTASVFIIEKFFSYPLVHSYGLIFISWIFCGGCIVLNLLSHYLSIKVYLWVHDSLPAQTKEQAAKINSRKGLVGKINLCSLFAYFLGLLFLIIFIGININYMNKKEISSIEKKGLEARDVQVVIPTEMPVTEQVAEFTNNQQVNDTLTNQLNTAKSN